MWFLPLYLHVNKKYGDNDDCTRLGLKLTYLHNHLSLTNDPSVYRLLEGQEAYHISTAKKQKNFCTIFTIKFLQDMSAYRIACLTVPCPSLKKLNQNIQLEHRCGR